MPVSVPDQNCRCHRSIGVTGNVFGQALLLVLCAAVAPAHAAADAGNGAMTMLATADVQFDTTLLSARGVHVDVSRFERGANILPGEYQVDLKVNDNWLGRQSVRFVEAADGSVQPCLSRQRLADWGVNLAAVDARAGKPDRQVMPLPDGEFCAALGRYIEDASVRFDSAEIAVQVSVPHAYSQRQARGWVDPAQWDRGVTAASLAYDATTFSWQSQGRSRRSGSLGVHAGLNLGGWNLRHGGYYHGGSGQSGRYQASYSHAQRDITALRAQLVLGQTSTAGTVFNSIGFTGARLYSDERMLPDSQRGYAPTIRGVATSNAKVAIYQRGYLLHEVVVAPGPFAIDDLYATGYGGDLDVEVSEADGRVQRFSVPFAAVPQLLRPGSHRFSVAAGRVHQVGVGDNPRLLEATWQRGINNALTGYTGVLSSNGYAAAQVGTAINTRIGAFAGDVSHARTTLPAVGAASGARLSGQSYRLSYSKSLPGSGTQFSLAAYRYSTDGYLDLRSALYLRQGLREGGGRELIAGQRSRVELNLSQSLGTGNGQLWATGSSSSYWNRHERQLGYSAGYSSSWNRISFSLSAQRSRINPWGYSRGDRIDTQYNLTVSVPLGQVAQPAQLTVDLGRSGRAGSSARVGISASPNDRFNYGASLERGSNGGATEVNANAGYRTGAAMVNASYSQGGGYRQVGAGLRGAVVVHPGGIALAQSLGDTIGIVHAPGAAGATLASDRSVVLDRRGYGVVPYLAPYRMNEVGLDPKGLPLHVELGSSSVHGAPRAGAVVYLPFVTRSGGRAALFDLVGPQGGALPFGADVLDAQGAPVGVVGQASRVWLRGIQTQGVLTVKWGAAAHQQCRIAYALPDAADQQGQAPRLLSARCDAITEVHNLPLNTPVSAGAQSVPNAAQTTGETR